MMAALQTEWLSDASAQPPPNRPLIIAHRGASGYLPEHTLAATAAAHVMGADYIEQDVVLTRDHIPVVLHDIHLDTVTDVASVFPDRRRSDGRHYVADFAWSELQRLSVCERRHVATGKAVYPERYPLAPPGQTPAARLSIATLAAHFELIQGLNRSTGREVGVFVELKRPAWHRAQGLDVSRAAAETLAQFGYRDRAARCYVECFDPAEVARLRTELAVQVKLVQLIGANHWDDAPLGGYDALLTDRGLAELAERVDGIAPWIDRLVERDPRGRPALLPLAANARRHGLEIHAFTLRADELPPFAANFPELIRTMAEDVQATGLFTDFPDQARAALLKLESK